jgi:UDP-N-acetyl-D-glucosamine dehydrogenase
VNSIDVVVVGQGYVGLPLSIAIAEAGFKVIGFDLNKDLVTRLNAGESHIEDIPGELLAKFLNSGNYTATSNPADFCDCAVAIIAVPTPLNFERQPDISYIESASKILGENLKNSTLIINESTSYPGTLRDVIAPIVNEHAQQNTIHSFAISPERVDPGNTDWNIKNTPRILAGLTEDAREKAREFYSRFCDNLVEVSSPEVAEFAKLFENTFRQVNIALVNEFATITEALDVSVNEVLEAAGTKPYGFMKFTPGLGVGGHCIPIDPSYLAYTAKAFGLEPKFIDLANKVNLETPIAVAKKIVEFFSGATQKKILVCGVSYKSNVADTRETPAASFIDALRKFGFEVSWHDPLVKSWRGEESYMPLKSEFDLTVIAMMHDAIDLRLIKASSRSILNLTDKGFLNIRNESVDNEDNN